MHRLTLAAALSIAALGSLIAFNPAASAAPISVPAQFTKSSSPIVQVDARCGRGHHYVPRHYIKGYRDRYGHFHKGHYVASRCVRN